MALKAEEMSKNRIMISIRVPPAKMDRLDAWRETQLVPPSRTSVIMVALDAFLDKAGAPPERNPQKRVKR